MIKNKMGTSLFCMVISMVVFGVGSANAAESLIMCGSGYGPEVKGYCYNVPCPSGTSPIKEGNYDSSHDPFNNYCRLAEYPYCCKPLMATTPLCTNNGREARCVDEEVLCAEAYGGNQFDHAFLKECVAGKKCCYAWTDLYSITPKSQESATQVSDQSSATPNTAGNNGVSSGSSGDGCLSEGDACYPDFSDSAQCCSGTKCVRNLSNSNDNICVKESGSGSAGSLFDNIGASGEKNMQGGNGDSGANDASSTHNPADKNSCPAGTVCFGNPVGADDLLGLVGNIMNGLRSVIVVVAIVFIVLGGIMYMSSAGSEKMIERAKAMIGGALIGLAITLAAPTFLREIITILGNASGGDPNEVVSRALTIKEIAEKLLRFLLSIAGILAIIGLVVGGTFYLTSYGDEDRTEKGREIIKASLIGIIITLAAVLLVKQIMSLMGVN